MQHYLATLGKGQARCAAIGIANPVVGDQVRMTNHHWSFSIEAVRQLLGLRALSRHQRLHRAGAVAAGAADGRSCARSAPARRWRVRRSACSAPAPASGVSGLLPARGGQRAIPINGRRRPRHAGGGRRARGSGDPAPARALRPRLRRARAVRAGPGQPVRRAVRGARPGRAAAAGRRRELARGALARTRSASRRSTCSSASSATWPATWRCRWARAAASTLAAASCRGWAMPSTARAFASASRRRGVSAATCRPIPTLRGGGSCVARPAGCGARAGRSVTP